MKLKLIISLAQSIKITNITYKIKTMAFKMKGMAPPQEPIGAGVNQRTNLGRGLGTIFGSKEKRDRNKAYFKKKREVRRALKEDGTYGDVNNETGMKIEGEGVNSGQFNNFGRSTAKTRGAVSKEVALSLHGDEKYFDRNNYVGAATTKKVKKKNINSSANANANANPNKLLSVDADIDVKKTDYVKDDAKLYKEKITPGSTKVIPGVTTPGEKKSKVFEGENALELANKFELEQVNSGTIKRKEEGPNMTSMGYQMKSSLFQLSGAEDKAKIMQVNRNPVTTSTSDLTTNLGYGTGTQTNTNQDDDSRQWSGKKSTAFKPSEKNDPSKNACADPNSAACKAWKKTQKIDGSSSMNQKVTVNYETPSTTTPDQTIVTPETKETTGERFGGQKGKKINVAVDADIKGKLPKIKLPKLTLPEVITDANKDGNVVSRTVDKIKKKRKERKTARNVAKGNCPPCPPCEK